jgi:hypothetical protein
MTTWAALPNRVAAGVVVAVLVLASATTASAYERHPTPIGLVDAQAAILTHADLTTAAGWKGGAVKPDTTDATGCAGFRPKTSDLIIIGDRESRFTHGVNSLDSEATVLATPRMTHLDWQRAIEAPGLLPCLRHGISTLPNAHLVRAAKLLLPKIATYTAAFRVVFQAGNGPRLRLDSIVFGRGRTEITLDVVSLASDASAGAAEISIARELASRIRT